MTERLMHFLLHKSFVVFVAAVLLLAPVQSFAYSSLGKPAGFVNDFAHVLTLEQKSSLENTLTLFNASTTNEISVVTVASLDGDYIENYAVKLFEEWGIGSKKNDNGVLLLVAVSDRKMRIEVGYGLEGVLTDSVSDRIIREDLTPYFKEGDFYGGLTSAVTRIIQVTQGEYSIDKKSEAGVSLLGFVFKYFELLVLLVVVVFQFFGAVLAQSKSWWAGGVIGLAAGGVITYFGVLGISLVFGLGITVLLTALGLVFDYFFSKNYESAVHQGRSPRWWSPAISSGGFRSSGGGSSFGGFGGGRSGGGGASGSW